MTLFEDSRFDQEWSHLPDRVSATGSLPLDVPWSDPAFPYDGKCFPTTDGASFTHFLRLDQSVTLGLHPAPTAPTYRPASPAHPSIAQPQVSPSPGDLGGDFLTSAENSFPPLAHPPGTFAYPVSQGAFPPAFPLPTPVASSDGPKRTGRPAQNARRYDPVESTKKGETKEDEDGWDLTPATFKAKINTMHHDALNEQPSRGIIPTTALADIDKFIKEDLKQSVGFFLLRSCSSSHKFDNPATAATSFGSRDRTSLPEGRKIPQGPPEVIRPAPGPTSAPREGGPVEENATIALLLESKPSHSLRSDLANSP